MRPTLLLFLLTLLLWSLSPNQLAAQRVLLLEKSGQNTAEKITEGSEITYRIKGDDFWQEGYIDELRPDIQAMVINDRFVMLDEVEALKFPGARFGGAAGTSLITFGLGWSTFALLGYATDGNPETSYGNRDLTVTLVSVGAGLLLRKIFQNRKYKVSDRKRLRVVDLTF